MLSLLFIASFHRNVIGTGENFSTSSHPFPATTRRSRGYWAWPAVVGHEFCGYQNKFKRWITINKKECVTFDIPLISLIYKCVKISTRRTTNAIPTPT